MKKVFFASFFCLLSCNICAGCFAPRIFTDIGISSGYSGSYTVNVLPGDSFLLKVSGCNCHAGLSTRISLNGQNIPPACSYCYLKLPCTPGVCKISATGGSGYFSNWTILFIAKQVIVESATTNPGPVAEVPKIKILNPDLLFYPNPAREELNIINETDEISSVTLYDQSGQLFLKYEINGARARIPLDSYPPGIYVIKVATITNKIIIRRISVL
ncbi:MAG TPA: T9SS type A sorting domain-containing protein [Bacteroidia bacterium]|nr:T9SS type A sorting domain-containing protein [Bacteroidia bacterium]